MPQRTFQGYLNEKRQDNLWPILPKILETFPRLSRQWLYFGEGPMFIGQDVPLDQQVPLQEVQQAVEQMARDANGTNKTLLQLVAGQAGEQVCGRKGQDLGRGVESARSRAGGGTSPQSPVDDAPAA